MPEKIIESQKDQKVLSTPEDSRPLEPSGPVLESAEQNERLSIESIQNFLKQERFDPLLNFDSLCSYAKSRASFLGVKKPVSIFLRSEQMEKTQHGSSLQTLRYNPTSQELYTGDWQWTTRAFHSPDGTFLDFPAHLRGKPQDGVLLGYEATDSLIDFAYTCEHELQHDLQTERIKGKEISYDALRLAKDYIVVGLLSRFDGGENFYHNAHDDLFLEADANDHANDFILKVMPVDGSLARRIVNPNDPPEHQRTAESVLLRRMDEGIHHDNYSLSLGENKIGIPTQKYDGSAEQIVSDFCDTILKVYPDYIKVYPALELEYNKDGSRRSLLDIKNLIKVAERDEGISINGQRIDSSRLSNIYHRLTKHSRRLQEEALDISHSK